MNRDHEKVFNLLLSITDNVLDEDAWTAFTVWFDKDGGAVDHYVTHQGVYTIPENVDDWTLGDLQKWLDEDSADHEHPQIYHEIMGINVSGFLVGGFLGGGPYTVDFPGLEG